MRREIARVCRHVVDGAPVVFAARYGELGSPEWEFRCAAAAHDEDDDRMLALDEVVRRDPSAVEIVLHPRGTTLERTAAGNRWHTGTGPVLFPHRPSRRYPRFEPRFPPRAGEPLDAADLRLMADVAQHGFHLVVSAGGGDAGAHAFSVGLFRSWDHPEIAIFGLSAEALASALTRVASLVRRGDRFEHGDVADGIVEGRPVAFRRIGPRHYAAHLGQAVWYHGGMRFPALQAVWADAAGHFPWDRWFARELRDVQPMLFESEPA